ncbi:glycosyltransferase family 2 protein [Paenibacillus paeoniae]|uniref:Glycosyltransferase family 2 protein n=2 Tax=Paenibacillus paeoniae TaxID=2292705 RepID=A0A371P1Z5_9BACL|nr:glycosyltransferase family 2 protein [Paenibacillus paeoniae]
MIVKNEEAVIKRCLDSVKGMVDEIVIVDTGSTDQTIEIARAYGASIHHYTWNHHFGDARNYALQHSTGDWNLVLDADEYIANDCTKAIRELMERGNCIGRVKRIDKFKDKEGVAYAQCYISRLFPAGVRYEGRIHEQVVSDLPRVRLGVEVGHDGYYEASRSDRNIPLLQMEIDAQQNNPYYHYQIAKEYNGIENFEQAHFHLKKAYNGLTKKEMYYSNTVVDYLYAMISSKQLDEGLAVIQSEAARLHDFPDFHFVSGQYYLELILSDTAKYVHLLPRIEQSYLKCLELGETDRYDSVIGTGSFSALHNLGVYHEVTGNTQQAVAYYREAASYGYAPSERRIAALTNM